MRRGRERLRAFKFHQRVNSPISCLYNTFTRLGEKRSHRNGVKDGYVLKGTLHQICCLVHTEMSLDSYLMRSKVTCASYKITNFGIGVKIHFSLFQGHQWEEIKTLQTCFPSSLLFPDVTLSLLLCLIQKSRLIPSQASNCFVT